MTQISEYFSTIYVGLSIRRQCRRSALRRECCPAMQCPEGGPERYDQLTPLSEPFQKPGRDPSRAGGFPTFRFAECERVFRPRFGLISSARNTEHWYLPPSPPSRFLFYVSAATYPPDKKNRCRAACGGTNTIRSLTFTKKKNPPCATSAS